MSRPIKKRPVEIPRPILYYNFDDDFVASTTLQDVMGANNGTLVGGVTTGVPGRIGQSFLFDGSTGYVETAIPTGSKSWLGGSGKVSMFATINMNDDIGNNTVYGAFGTNANEREFTFRIVPKSGAGYLSFEVSNGSSTNTFRVEATTPNPIPLNVVTHVAITFDNSVSGQINKINLYINGQPIEKEILFNNGTFTGITDISANQWVGRLSPWGGQHFPGSIDEFGVFSEVLTAEQIAELSARSLARKPAFAQVPVTDYDIWWSARNVDGQGNATLTGPKVTSWSNQGSIGVDAAQGTVADQPLLRPFQATTSRNTNANRPGVKFTGALHHMRADGAEAPFTGGGAPTTMFLVLRQDIVSGNGVWVGMGNSATTEQALQLGPSNLVPPNKNRISFKDNQAPPNDTTDSMAIQDLPTGTLISTGFRSTAFATQLSDWVNGKSDGTFWHGLFGTAPPFVNNLSLDQFGIHVLPRTTEGLAPDDTIYYEILLYSRTLTDSEMTSLQNWAAEEYPDLEFQQLVFATNPDTTVEDIPVTVNVEAAGNFPEPNAYWSMDNAALVGSTALDLVGGYNAINQAGATSGSTGQVGQGISYSSATTGRADLGTMPANLLVSTYTHSAWVNFNSIAAGFQALYSFGVSAADQAMLFEGTAEEIHYVSYYTGGLGNTNTPRPVRSLTTSVWYHFAMVRDVANNELRGYFNGEKLSTFTLDGTTAIYGAADGTFAARNNAGDQSADCILDEFGYWTVALTDANIQTVYERGLQGLRLVE